MEVEYTKCFVPEIERVKETVTIYKNSEDSQPVIKDQDGHIIAHNEWFCLAYRPVSMTQYEFDLFEEWHDDVDSLYQTEIIE